MAATTSGHAESPSGSASGPLTRFHCPGWHPDCSWILSGEQIHYLSRVELIQSCSRKRGIPTAAVVLYLRSSGGSGSASGHAAVVRGGPAPLSFVGRCDQPQVCCHSIGPDGPGSDAGHHLDGRRLACSENETSGASVSLKWIVQGEHCHALVGHLSAPSCDDRPPMGGSRMRSRVAGPMLQCPSGRTQR